MQQILIGSHNLHKVKEISNLLSDLPVTIKSLSDFPSISEVVEDGKTLKENAMKKAKNYAEKTNLLTLADDTGLEVDALAGDPGVRSARYAGEHCSYSHNNKKLLANLAHCRNGERGAHFRCVIALCEPKTRLIQTAEGILHGEILTEERGKNGFGYDPIFFIPHLKKTLAELSMEEKNRISHRAQAVLKAKEILKKYLLETAAQNTQGARNPLS